MEKYVALLRGINVGGKRVIKMADLKRLMEEAGFVSVSTYIQSGNIVFTTIENKIDKIENTIFELILSAYGFEVPVIVRSQESIKKIVEENLFLEKANGDLARLHVTFLKRLPNRKNIDKMQAINVNPDSYSVSVNNIYIFCIAGYKDTKCSNTFFEKKLEVSCTTRNWKTVLKIKQMME